MDRVVITVDGLAGSGKSTLSRMLAERLGFVHLNTGLFYRGSGYLVRKEGVDFKNQEAAAEVIRNHTLEIDFNKDNVPVLLIDGNEIPNKDLYTPLASEGASLAGATPGIRAALIDAQKNAFGGKVSLVAEGRDVGTVIFPDADLKFFIKADAEVRATRLLKERDIQDGPEAQEALRLEIGERDRRDIERALAPTIAASDASIIDNSTRPIEVVLDEMISQVEALCS